MTTNEGEREQELRLLRQGAAGVAELFARHRDRLRRAVEFRLDRRLVSRVDCEDVLQEAFLQVSRRASDFLRRPTVPFFVWARQISLQILTDLHRKHLGAVMRDVKLEVSLERLAWVAGSSSDLGIEIAGDLTSPSEAAARNEVALQLHEALLNMNENDREVLILRHLEELTNKEVADVLGLDKSAASRRYMRALERLRTAFPWSPRDNQST